MNNAISEYTTLHPNIKVKVVKKAGLDVYDAYKLALNDNKARPDIAILDHVYVQALAHDNQLADLSELGSDVDTKIFSHHLSIQLTFITTKTTAYLYQLTQLY